MADLYGGAFIRSITAHLHGSGITAAYLHYGGLHDGVYTMVLYTMAIYTSIPPRAASGRNQAVRS